MLESLFNKVAGLQPNVNNKRLQHRYFPVDLQIFYQYFKKANFKKNLQTFPSVFNLPAGFHFLLFFQFYCLSLLQFQSREQNVALHLEG